MKNILIVDDELTILMLLQKFLLREGYNVCVSDQWEEAVEKYD